MLFENLLTISYRPTAADWIAQVFRRLTNTNELLQMRNNELNLFDSSTLFLDVVVICTIVAREVISRQTVTAFFASPFAPQCYSSVIMLH